MVRKTVNDELRATIWEPQHMDKIVPSLLFNMQKTEEVDRYLIRALGGAALPLWKVRVLAHEAKEVLSSASCKGGL